jgi:hypothetical protein
MARKAADYDDAPAFLPSFSSKNANRRIKKARGGSLDPPRGIFRVTNSQKVHSWKVATGTARFAICGNDATS